MEYGEFKAGMKKGAASKAATERRIVFANTGSGVGVHRGINGTIIEFNTLSGIGVDVRMAPDDRTVTIDASSIIDRIDAINSKYNTLSTAILTAERTARDGDATLKSRLGQLEARPGYVLPQPLAELAQMPRFHGSVPVIQHGKWAALNLSNDFFNKYEAKMDACVAVGGDVQRSVKDYTTQLNDIRQNIEKMSNSVKYWKIATVALGVMVIILAIK